MLTLSPDAPQRERPHIANLLGPSTPDETRATKDTLGHAHSAPQRLRDGVKHT